MFNPPSNRKAFLASSAGALAAGALAGPARAAQQFPPTPLPPEDLRADPDMQGVLQKLADFNAPRLPQVTPDVARELPSFSDALQAALSSAGKPAVEPVGKVFHVVIPGVGGQLLLRVYVPAGSAPYPVIMYFHGGGFVIADLDTYDATPRYLANGTGAAVVSVAYRKAPEHPFPAAVEDAFTAYEWVLANAASMGGDPKRVAVAGESAGGNLATVVAILARDRKVPLPVHQLLVYPVTSFVTPTPPPPSFSENPTTIPLATPDLAFFTKYYLRGNDAMNPLASPILANLNGLPSATIINADIDPLRDAGKAYAEKLQAAGVRVTRTVYTGVTHEFFGMVAAVAKARTAMLEATTALRTSFR